MRQISLNLLYILTATIFAGSLQSCDDDHFQGDDGGGPKITITATTAFSNTTSRAVYEDGDNFAADDIAIENYCFLLFDNEGLLIQAFDLGKNDLPFEVTLKRPVSDNVDYTAFLLGNVSLAKLGISPGDNMSELNAKTYEITRTYNSPKESEKNLFTWSGYLPLKQSTKSLDFMLNPNVAKITATIKNTSTNSRIRSVRIKNVANKVRYAQNALTKSSSFDISNNTTGGVEFIDYDMEDNLDLGQNGEAKISWYVPHNQAGTGNRTDNAPATATYLQIDAVSTADGVKDNNVATCYKVYPGLKAGDNQSYADMTDFNVIADHIYNLNVTISDDGVSSEITDGFMPDKNLATNIIKLPKNSNCYMIHPIGDRIKGGTVYELPIDRINQYWKDIAKDASRTINQESEWKVFVVWQDINTRAITFCDEYGNAKESTDASGQVYSPGVGKNPFYFKLNNTSTDASTQTYGNVVVGVKKNNMDGYLWSWHLWITDYNPDAAPAHNSNPDNLYYDDDEVDIQGAMMSTTSSTSWTDTDNAVKSYAHRPGIGNVQHYHSEYAPYWTNSGRTESAAVWDGSGIYANKWIMDRNLGAQSPNNSEVENPLDGWGMYYQFGRKDPFSYKKTYDINGNIRPEGYTEYGKQWKTETGTRGTIKLGINNPNTYYAYDGHWASDQGANNYDWCSPTPPRKKGAKTLFDPCPPGWCVPVVDALAFGTYTYPRTNLNDATSSVFQEYTRRFVDDVTTSNWAHTSVCVYINVEGVYRAPVYGTASGQIDYRNQSNEFNIDNSLKRYGSRWRNFMVLYSTSEVGGSVRKLKTHYPLQGHVDGANGSIAKVFHADGLTPIQNTATPQGWWRDYLCCTYKDKDNYFTSATGLQLRLWGCERGSATQGTLVNSTPSTMDYNVNARQERRNSFLYLRFHGTSCHLYVWNASNGFNVRCVQEPD